MIDLSQILTGLLKRTTEGKVQWSRTVQNDRFVTSFDAVSVMLGDADRGYLLEILDEEGEIVESLGYQETSAEQDEEMLRLYVLARRSAYNIDKTLQKLARALEL